jgi:molybdopterin-biosynthesis enzyme MoeA-like protein
MATAGSEREEAGVAPKAAIMMIGAELLNGSVTDTNTPWLAKLLYR